MGNHTDDKMHKMNTQLIKLDNGIQQQLKAPTSKAEFGTYMLEGDQRKYAAKVTGAHQEILAGYNAQNEIYIALQYWWRFATKEPDYWDTTWEDLEGLQRPLVPPVQYRIAQRDGDLFTTDEYSDSVVGFAMRFIPPLHPHYIRALVNTFCDPSIRESMLSNPDLENVRLYVRLGEMSPPDEAKSTKLSRPVYFDQLLRAQPTEKMVVRAKQMGVFFAIIHCKCQHDGAGVEFQLAMHHKKRKVVMWVTNFAHCKPFGIGPYTERKLAKALADNPALPKSPYAFKPERSERARAVKSVWLAFKNAYLCACHRLLRNMKPGSKFSPIDVMDYLTCMMAPPVYLCKI